VAVAFLLVDVRHGLIYIQPSRVLLIFERHICYHPFYRHRERVGFGRLDQRYGSLSLVVFWAGKQVSGRNAGLLSNIEQSWKTLAIAHRSHVRCCRYPTDQRSHGWAGRCK
jgi:hypothetical protein